MTARRRGLAVASAVVAAATTITCLTRLSAGAATATANVSKQAGCKAAAFPLEPLAQAQRQARSMVGRMTLEQEVALMTGVGSFKPPSGTVGSTAAIGSLGIPPLNQQDGPGGIGDLVTGVTQLPAPEDLAATFDPRAAACYGQVIGTEARGKGINLVYGPTVNIVRVPQWGRAFETLGEDPYLTGAMAGAEVTGLQRAGTMAEVKHYAVYNQEADRNTPADDSIVSDKALQEIYLRAWDQIVESSPASVMCSYSTINGDDACQDPQLLDGYLDGTLHFPGFVSSDYYAAKSTGPAVDVGLDQEQPLPIYFGPKLVAAVQDGQVKRSTIDQAAVRILTQMYRFRLFTQDASGSIHKDVATAADARIGQQIAVEGTTLLKNSDHTLPLAATGPGTIAVIGPAAAADPVTVGGGSATVTATHTVTPVAGMRDALGGRRVLTYTPGLPPAGQFTPIPAADLSTTLPSSGDPANQQATLVAPDTGTYELAFSEPVTYSPVTLTIDGTALAVNPGTLPRSTYVVSVNLDAGRSYTVTGPVQKLSWVTPSAITQDITGAVAAAQRASTAVVVVGDGQESEAADRATLALPGDQDQLIRAVASANKHTVVVVDAGGPVLMPWLSSVSAVIDAWYPGQSDGAALASVLFGNTDPSGHLPVTFPAAPDRDPVSSPAQFPGVEGEVQYSEGVDVGYRWYDATRTAPLFPFGFGLSYTSFRYSSPSVHATTVDGRPRVTATVRVTNVGKRSGADVAQLYVSQPATSGEPPRQLEAFQRVSLEPGASAVVGFTLSGRQLGYYNPGTRTWRIAAGRYRAWMGDSSATQQLPVQADFHIARSAGIVPTSSPGGGPVRGGS